MTTPIAPTGTSTYTANNATRAPQQEMNADVFMQLLVTQLRNQDPSSPMDTNEMLAQTTQLASMEQLTTLTGLTEENFSLNMRAAAAGLLGQTVSYTGEDGAPLSGTVSSVTFAAKVPVVNVNGVAVRLDELLGAGATP
jgi:flagellar basal-body rod modification protein FlgD